MTERIRNSKVQDSSSKLIFGDNTLCSQFLKGYVDIPLFQELEPGDIEDVTERYVPMFTEERCADVVKRVNLKGEQPFFLVSLIEHKSGIDYNVTMQILRYMVYIWEDYEKECEKSQRGISKTKGFKYPPILPIVYYEGVDDWQTGLSLKERIFLEDVFAEYIPDFSCKLVSLQKFSNQELISRQDELSLILMVCKLQDMAGFAELGEDVKQEQVQEIVKRTPEYLLDLMAKVVGVLLRNARVPDEEAEQFLGHIKERKMGMLFENFAKNLELDREQRKMEGTAIGIIRVLRKYAASDEEILGELTSELSVDRNTAVDFLTRYDQGNLE